MKGEILSWSLLGVKGLSCQHMSIFSALCDLKQELIGLPFSIQLTLPLRWQGLRRVRMTRKWAPAQVLALSRRALSEKLKKQPTGKTLTPLVRWAQIRGQDQAPWARWILLISCWRAEESLKGFVENFCGESLGISLPTGLNELDQFIQRTLFSVHMKKFWSWSLSCDWSPSTVQLRTFSFVTELNKARSYHWVSSPVTGLSCSYGHGSRQLNNLANLPSHISCIEVTK